MGWHIAAGCSGSPAGYVFFWNRERNLTRQKSPRPIARTYCEIKYTSFSQHWTSEPLLVLLHTATVLLLFLIIDYSGLLQPIESARRRRRVKLYMGLITTDSWSGSGHCPLLKWTMIPLMRAKPLVVRCEQPWGYYEGKLSEHDFEGRNTQRRIFFEVWGTDYFYLLAVHWGQVRWKMLQPCWLISGSSILELTAQPCCKVKTESRMSFYINSKYTQFMVYLKIKKW